MTDKPTSGLHAVSHDLLERLHGWLTHIHHYRADDMAELEAILKQPPVLSADLRQQLADVTAERDEARAELDVALNRVTDSNGLLLFLRQRYSRRLDATDLEIIDAHLATPASTSDEEVQP